MPSTNPKPEECADVDLGWKSLFTGVDLSGWKGTDEQKAHWKTGDGVLICDGKGKHEDVRVDDGEIVWRFRNGLRMAEPRAARMAVLWTTLRLRGDGYLCYYWEPSVWWLANPPLGGCGGSKDWAQSSRQMEPHCRSCEGRQDQRALQRQASFDGFQIGDSDASGPLALSSEEPMRFRNIFIRELKEGE